MRAARKVFLRDGYERATVAAIAATAGTSPATLYKHFPTGKAQIFGEVVSEGAGTVFPAVQNAADGRQTAEEALRGFAHAYARMLLDPKTAGFFRIVIAETPKLPELGEQWQNAKERIARELGRLLAERGGSELHVTDIPLAADQLLGLLVYALVWPALLTPGWRPKSGEIERAVEESIATFLARYARTSSRGTSVRIAQ